MLIKITNTYGGQEGKRVKAGRVFFAGNPDDRPHGFEDADVITTERGKQLRHAGLAKALNEDPPRKAAPGSRPASPPGRQTKVEPTRRKKVDPPPNNGVVTGKQKRKTPTKKPTASGVPKAPAAPAKISGPSAQPGSQTGKAQSASSSAADPQTKPSTSNAQKKKRGQRSGGSASTTPTSSSQSPTSSTDATQDGGSSTPEKSPPEDTLE